MAPRSRLHIHCVPTEFAYFFAVIISSHRSRHNSNRDVCKENHDKETLKITCHIRHKNWKLCAAYTVAVKQKIQTFMLAYYVKQAKA